MVGEPNVWAFPKEEYIKLLNSIWDNLSQAA
jgi:hypothetical protein